MENTARKMTRIVEEMVLFFFSIGSEKINMDIQKREGGYTLYMASKYDPEHRCKLEKLEKIFRRAQRNEGMEETYWQLAGASMAGEDTEFALIGSIVDSAKVEISDDMVEVVMVKKMTGNF